MGVSVGHEPVAAAIAEGTAIEQCASNKRGARTERLPLGRRALDDLIGRLARRAASAVDGIVEPGESAASESVRLSALRAVMSDRIAVSNFAGLEVRVTALEEQTSARTDNKS